MMARTDREKMLAGELYNAAAPELQAEMAVTHKWLTRYNAALSASASDLRKILLERLAAVGEGVMIWPPFHCDCGFNISSARVCS
jgi:maltose O-acetyltransferase